jgi:hydrogenase small subunit
MPIGGVKEKTIAAKRASVKNLIFPEKNRKDFEELPDHIKKGIIPHFVESFDDENAKRGYCLYKMGCKGPSTYNSCGVIKWNNGVSFPIQSGHPCIGCSEANFWDNDPFYQHLPGFKGFGIEKTADRIGLGLGIATAVGIGAHMLSTNVQKRREIRQGDAEKKSET